MREHHISRLSVLAGLLLAVLLIYVAVLCDIQINQHDDYLAQSIHSIAQEEPIEASRGVITDRKGRVMVTNRSVYNLLLDTDLLGKDDDLNEAILRLLELCQGQNKTWTDTLPISRNAPYSYALEGLTDDQKLYFLSYVRSLEDAEAVLIDYILQHPELADPAEDEAADTDKAAGEDTQTPEQQGADLLDRLPASAVTADLFTQAGLSAQRLLFLMRTDYDIPSDFTADQARQVLGVRYDLRYRGTGTLTLAEDVNTAFISLVSDGRYAGARITSSSVREYTTPYAAHILGVMGALDPEDLENPFYDDYPMNAIVGKSGVEAAFEKYLRGQDGVRIISTNEEGKITGQYYDQEPEPGNTVELTIDLELQQVVEDTLASTVNAMNERDGETDRGAAAVVQLVDSGELLAIASYPTYSLATYRQDVGELSQDTSLPLINRATGTGYAPGSTIKPLTAVAALEEGIITPTEKIRSPAYWSYPNDPSGIGTRCVGGDHGRINVTEAITESCNYFFAQMGYELGMDTFREYLQKFGLGERTGIEIGDSTGKLPENPPGEDQAPWAAFGQGNQAYTPVQLANYVATLASGGIRRTPHLLKAVKTYDSAEVIAVGDTDPVADLGISDSTLEAVKEGMYGYTQPGGPVYSAFRNCVVSAGAKTGTSQLGGDQTDNGVFICFAPYEDPEIAVAIVIEHATWGSNLASAAVEILNAYFTAGQETAAVTGENQLLP